MADVTGGCHRHRGEIRHEVLIQGAERQRWMEATRELPAFGRIPAAVATRGDQSTR
ncbi:hypothetical protein ACVW1C_001417 [Bradyrhizobium sp. USDA 4011]